MADKIKAFFRQKKAEAKFKTVGGGQKLGDSSKTSQPTTQQSRKVPERQHPSQSAQQAGAAALNRVAGGQEKEEDALRRRQQARIKEQARRELEKEQQVEAEIAKVKEIYGEKEEVVVEAPTASGGVYFRCPLVGEDVCGREEMKRRIREFLFSQLECGERGLTAVLIIHTCNSPREKVATCVETLGKYIDNILSHPEENKYRKIRKSNKAFQERVGGLEGTVQFLEGCGFQTAQMEGPEGAPEDFWVLPSEVTDMETLRSMLEALRGAEPVVAELDRATKILPPGQKIDNNPLPQDFFSISGEELKKEQERRTELAEREGILRTKAMREKEEQKSRRKYRYCLIRIRFPDGWLLQGTFAVQEHLSAVSEFVSEHLETPLPHILADSVTGQKFRLGEEGTLADLGLVPAALLNFSWDPEIEADLAAAGGFVAYLREDLKAL